MTDMFSPQKRSQIMARVRSADTAPELRVRRLLHGLGKRFRLHRRDLPGQPDLVLPKYKAVIFVHGCFWHGCPVWKHARIRPAANAAYWANKLDRTLTRDKNNIAALEQMGWRVLVVWECETRKKRLPELAEKIENFLSQRFYV
jgi:DNA mismatch endonuclease (patch repair protein)